MSDPRSVPKRPSGLGHAVPSAQGGHLGCPPRGLRLVPFSSSEPARRSAPLWTFVLTACCFLEVFAALGAPASQSGLSGGVVCAWGAGARGPMPVGLLPRMGRRFSALPVAVTVGGGLPGEEEGGREHPEEKLRLDLGLVESAGERPPQVSPLSAPHPAGRGPPPPSLPQPSPPGSSCSGARGARPRSACATPAS